MREDGTMMDDESPWHPWPIWTSYDFIQLHMAHDQRYRRSGPYRVLASPCTWRHEPSGVHLLPGRRDWRTSSSCRLTRLTRLVVSECFRVVLESKRTHFIYFSSLQFPQEIFSIFIHHFWYFPASHCHPLVFKVVPKRGEFDRTCAKVFRVTTLKVGGRPVEAQQPAPVRLRVAMKIQEGPWRSMNHKEHIGKHTDTNSIESW